MKKSIFELLVKKNQDIVLIRQKACQIAKLLGFEHQEQVKIATAVSEVTRIAFDFEGGAKVSFLIKLSSPMMFYISIQFFGANERSFELLNERYPSSFGTTATGLWGAKKLMDFFDMVVEPHVGTFVNLGKILPKSKAGEKDLSQYQALIQESAQFESNEPMDELRRQNQELFHALVELRVKQEELIQLNRELADTNRGVVALYAELDEKAESLKRSSKAKNQFYSNLTHELRSPLNAILSLTRIVLSEVDGKLSSDHKEQIKFIYDATQELSDLVNDLLDIARAESGKVEIKPSTFKITDLFNSLKGILKPLVDPLSEVKLTFSPPDKDVELCTDLPKLSQILRNLISNALKFTEKGEVVISMRQDFSKENILFDVRDTGIGIQPSDLTRIFEEFIQIDSSLQRKSKGSGLGLPLCQKLVRLLGGNIQVDSQIGEGSCFSVSIPVQYGSQVKEFHG